jgi:hypothetical protein
MPTLVKYIFKVICPSTVNGLVIDADQHKKISNVQIKRNCERLMTLKLGKGSQTDVEDETFIFHNLVLKNLGLNTSLIGISDFAYYNYVSGVLKVGAASVYDHPEVAQWIATMSSRPEVKKSEEKLDELLKAVI